MGSSNHHAGGQRVAISITTHQGDPKPDPLEAPGAVQLGIHEMRFKSGFYRGG